ncbi:MAG TPA: sulfite exporter TauE/SafE family protein [Gemmatimonadaceae bacterium]|nr:sulfite exporter TauE/SafE family protein [Gemmatimonadaceae bacterium]
MHTPQPLVALLLGVVAFVAATLAAVTGFGGAAVLLPVLAAVFGVREAIPILTVAQLIGNGSRVWFNRREVDWRVVGWFALGAVPFAFAGGVLFARAPLSPLTRLLGVFLIFVVVWRRLHPGPPRPPPLRSFAGIGAGAAFLSALLGSVGPIMAPFFLAFGLVRGAYIGTEAMSTVVMHVVKLVAYGQGSLLTARAVLAGLALGPIMVLGSWAGKRIVDRLSERVFVSLIELTLLAAGFMFLIRGA